MKRSNWMLLRLLMLGLIFQLHPAAAQDQPNGFSDAFFEDIGTPSEMTGLWNRSFTRCEAAGQKPLEDCILDRATRIIGHGGMTGPRCARVAHSIARHYCIVIGSIAADLMVKFELDSADGFIEAQTEKFEQAIDSAGTQVWSYLNQKCLAPEASPDCLSDEVSRRLQSSARDTSWCHSNTDAHGQADCLIARWFASQISAAAMAENVGVSGDFFFDERVEPAVNDLARRGQAKCGRLRSAAGPDCLIESVAAVLPYGNHMMSYCREITDLVDRYLCVLTGAIAADLYVAIGVGTADAFLKEYGNDGERALNQADAKAAHFLAEKCPENTGVPRCGPKEVAGRLETESQALKLCMFLTEDRQSINCLMANHVINVLRTAERQL